MWGGCMWVYVWVIQPNSPSRLFCAALLLTKPCTPKPKNKQDQKLSRGMTNAITGALVRVRPYAYTFTYTYTYIYIGLQLF